MHIDIAGQAVELDRQPPGEADQQPHGYQRDAERDEKAAEGTFEYRHFSAYTREPMHRGDLRCSRNATTIRREEPASREDRHEYCRHLRLRPYR